MSNDNLDKDTIFNFIDQYFIERVPLSELNERLDNLKDEMDDISDNVDEVYDKIVTSFEKSTVNPFDTYPKELQDKILKPFRDSVEKEIKDKEGIILKDKEKEAQLHFCDTTLDMMDLYEIKYGRTVFSEGNTWYLYSKKSAELVVYIAYCPFCGIELKEDGS